jgi:flagellar biosynthesis/type III secretory pathway chaperone
VDKIWQELCDVLADMLSAYQKMLELGLAKRAALIDSQINDIEGITKKEETLIIFITHSEKIRKAVLAKIADYYQVSQDEINLAKIKELTDGKMDERFENLERDFHKTLSEIQSLNKTNNELIQQALSFVNYNINLLTQNVDDGNYAPKGQGGLTTQGRAIFDRKV